MTKRAAGKNMQVSLIHMQISESPEKNLETAEQMLYRAADSGSKFICLPEYFAFPASVEDRNKIEDIAEQTRKPAVNLLKRVSKDVDAYIVGGTIFEMFRGKYYNTCMFLKNGKILGKFRKMHLTDWEKKVGLNVGSTFKIFETEHCRAGILICADVFYPRTVRRLASLGAEVIFLPVSASRTHPPVQGHPLTTKRAEDNRVFILKNGNTRSNSRGGNSAIISPWGILNQAKDEMNTKIISADLDITKLRKHRLNAK
ncbi:MAG: carbon-nitrogen hydrolase family protein [Candidatus Bathyarchaeota archaeon]|nr:carbon-nitrogen hydrolase family protein [Candidatus Bathyarchaeum sp.]